MRKVPKDWKPIFTQPIYAMGDFISDPGIWYRNVIGWLTPHGFVSPDKLKDTNAND